MKTRNYILIVALLFALGCEVQAQDIPLFQRDDAGLIHATGARTVVKFKSSWKNVPECRVMNLDRPSGYYYRVTRRYLSVDTSSFRSGDRLAYHCAAPEHPYHARALPGHCVTPQRKRLSDGTRWKCGPEPNTWYQCDPRWRCISSPKGTPVTSIFRNGLAVDYAHAQQKQEPKDEADAPAIYPLNAASSANWLRVSQAMQAENDRHNKEMARLNELGVFILQGAGIPEEAWSGCKMGDGGLVTCAKPPEKKATP